MEAILLSFAIGNAETIDRAWLPQRRLTHGATLSALPRLARVSRKCSKTLLERRSPASQQNERFAPASFFEHLSGVGLLD
jgi:hypothetical protein